MGKHKDDVTASPNISLDSETGHVAITVRPDYIIFVEPIGHMTGQIVSQMLTDLKQTVEQVRHAGHPVYILVNISRISGHDT